MTRTDRTWALGLAVTMAILAGCPASRPAPTAAVELRPPEAFVGDFLLQQQLTFERGEVTQTLQTALQRQGDTLTLIGLTPMGTRAFVLTQTGDEVTFTSHLPEDRPLPFPPRQVLLDIQRTLLPVVGPGRLDDGEHEGDGVTERWRGGRLRERRFRTAEGEVVIRYGDEGYLFGERPGRLEVDNGPMGYRLTLETLAFQPL